MAYVKWDMNRSLTDVWSASLPPERQGEVYHRFVLGVYEVLERMRRDFPNLLIEGCCGGGGRFDGGMLYYTPQIWCSDDSDAIARLRIQYGTSFCYPIVAMSGAFGYEMDLSKCTDEEKEAVREQVASYKAHYGLIHSGNYFRLSPPGGGSLFTAWAHVSQDRREALVSLVAGGARPAPPFCTLRLKGLNPALNYQIERDGEATVYSGESLMRAGYPLPLFHGDYQSLQFYLHAM